MQIYWIQYSMPRERGHYDGKDHSSGHGDGHGLGWYGASCRHGRSGGVRWDRPLHATETAIDFSVICCHEAHLAPREEGRKKERKEEESQNARTEYKNTSG